MKQKRMKKRRLKAATRLEVERDKVTENVDKFKLNVIVNFIVTNNFKIFPNSLPPALEESCR